jgi:excisionase family DNA binding protein
MNHEECHTAPMWLSVGEAAGIVGVSRQTIYSWIKRGYLRVEYTYGWYLINPADFARLRAIRGAAATAGVRLRTMRRWVDDSAR